MRIIAGKLGGRTINPPLNDWPTRPTTDRTRESLFNILENVLDWHECECLDLFGGTGIISFEMISRGATTVDYVEQYAKAVQFVEKASSELNIEDQLNIYQRDVFLFIEHSQKSYHLIYADPPYQMYRSRDLPDLILENNLLKKEGILVLEHDASIQFKEHPKIRDVRNYGQTYLSFFRNVND